jgi:hypothetical protein
MSFPNGDQYEGAWEQDMRHGYGELRFIRGDFFQGQWMNDRMHGQGVMRHYEGSVFEGLWDNGERVDQKGHFNYANGL